MTIYDTTLVYVAPATKAWSVYNQMRGYRLGRDADDVRPGLFTRNEIYARWRDAELQPAGPGADPMPISWVDDGITFLVANGFATYNAGTGVITPTRLDTDNRPSRLRRKPSDSSTLEYLPPGATPQEGT